MSFAADYSKMGATWAGLAAGYPYFRLYHGDGRFVRLVIWNSIRDCTRTIMTLGKTALYTLQSE